MPHLSINDVELYPGLAADGGATLEFAVTLDAPATEEVKVHVATEDLPGRHPAVAGKDYEAASADLVFAPGEKRQTFPVKIAGKAAPSADMTFLAVLSNASVPCYRTRGAGIIMGVPRPTPQR